MLRISLQRSAQHDRGIGFGLGALRAGLRRPVDCGPQLTQSNSKTIFPLRLPCAACPTAALTSLSGYAFSSLVFSQPRLALSKGGRNVSMRSDGVALSYHLLIQMPRNRRSLKMKRPVGIFSGCKLIAPK